MSATTEPARSPAIQATLIDLANALDGIADLGITVCLLDEDRMAGRHAFILKHAERFRTLVASVLSSTDRLDRQDAARLLAGSGSFLNAFLSLEHHRSLDIAAVRSATEAFRDGWEAVHDAVRAVAEKFGLLNEEWYSAIVERRPAHRERLAEVFTSFEPARLTQS